MYSYTADCYPIRKPAKAPREPCAWHKKHTTNRSCAQRNARQLVVELWYTTTQIDQKRGGIVDKRAQAYADNLPEVETSRLPLGTLFLAQGRIYQVTETSAGGFHKAREWRKTERTDVALVPGSFPSRFLPLIRRGRVLPVYRSRQELTDDNQLLCFVFPTETLALEAAELDVALVQSGGVYVRAHGDEPAFAATDGVHNYRLYYYRQSAAGQRTKLTRLENRPTRFTIKPHTEGPEYWRLLSRWVEALPNFDVTRPIKRLDVSELEKPLPHIPDNS